jgi:chitinase
MTFVPEGLSQGQMISQIDQMKARGKKVLVSLGGQLGTVKLNNATEVNTFVSSMTNVLNTFHFDGMDIDLEGQFTVTGGTTIANPTDVLIVNLISGIRQVMANYRTTHHKKMMLTMAPEVACTQGGITAYGGPWGSYLPVLHALRDSIDILHVQLYNAPGGMRAIDGQIYYHGTPDYIVSMTDAVIRGFTTGGGQFSGFRADQIAIGLPACSAAAPAGGYIHPDSVKKAINYLMGRGPKPGNYTLQSSHPTLRGMMTWSINWDRITTCNPTSYEFAKNYHRIFNLGSIGINENNSTVKDYSLNQNFPNPFNPSTVINFEVNKPGVVFIQLYDNLGKEVQTLANKFYNRGSHQINFNAENLTAGTYYYKLTTDNYTETRKMVLVK